MYSEVSTHPFLTQLYAMGIALEISPEKSLPLAINTLGSTENILFNMLYLKKNHWLPYLSAQCVSDFIIQNIPTIVESEILRFYFFRILFDRSIKNYWLNIITKADISIGNLTSEGIENFRDSIFEHLSFLLAHSDRSFIIAWLKSWGLCSTDYLNSIHAQFDKIEDCYLKTDMLSFYILLQCCQSVIPLKVRDSIFYDRFNLTNIDPCKNLFIKAVERFCQFDALAGQALSFNVLGKLMQRNAHRFGIPENRVQYHDAIFRALCIKMASNDSYSLSFPSMLGEVSQETLSKTIQSLNSEEKDSTHEPNLGTDFDNAIRNILTVFNTPDILSACLKQLEKDFSDFLTIPPTVFIPLFNKAFSVLPVNFMSSTASLVTSDIVSFISSPTSSDPFSSPAFP